MGLLILAISVWLIVTLAWIWRHVKKGGEQGAQPTIRFELSADVPVSQQKVEETKVALRELFLSRTHCGPCPARLSWLE